MKWGLGIGDWAQSPIPNPQSPLFYIIKKSFKLFNIKIFNKIFLLHKIQ